MRYVWDDGGRKAAGFRGDADDCVCRAIAIATGRPYREVYREINAFAKDERYKRGRVGLAAATGRGSSSRDGVLKPTTRAYLLSLGWQWTPTMRVGQGCKTHLRAEKLPAGRLIVALSRHIAAVVDGAVHDTYDPRRGGTRCVYGYYSPPQVPG